MRVWCNYQKETVLYQKKKKMLCKRRKQQDDTNAILLSHFLHSKLDHCE